MSQLLRCATTSPDKLMLARHGVAEFGLELTQVTPEIDEIQGADGEAIVKHKAASAYAALGEPVVVTDDLWSIPALRGFPGAYMKEVNKWFKPADWLRLMAGVSDRRIYLTQHVAYQSELEVVVFRNEIAGQLALDARGDTGTDLFKLVCLDIDQGRTIAEVYAAHAETDPERLRVVAQVWRAFGAWYTEHVV